MALLPQDLRDVVAQHVGEEGDGPRLDDRHPRPGVQKREPWAEGATEEVVVPPRAGKGRREFGVTECSDEGSDAPGEPDEQEGALGWKRSRHQGRHAEDHGADHGAHDEGNRVDRVKRLSGYSPFGRRRLRWRSLGARDHVPEPPQTAGLPRQAMGWAGQTQPLPAGFRRLLSPGVAHASVHPLDIGLSGG